MSRDIRVMRLSKLLDESKETVIVKDTSEYKDGLERWARTGIACALDFELPTEKAKQSYQEALRLAEALAGNDDPRVLFDAHGVFARHLAGLPDSANQSYYPKEKEMLGQMKTRLLEMFWERLASES